MKTLWFFCPNGHVFEHDSVNDESVSWDFGIPAKCKDCGHPSGLMGPYVNEGQASYVMDMRRDIRSKRSA